MSIVATLQYSTLFQSLDLMSNPSFYNDKFHKLEEGTCWPLMFFNSFQIFFQGHFIVKVKNLFDSTECKLLSGTSMRLIQWC